jgi:hypothetical protein
VADYHSGRLRSIERGQYSAVREDARQGEIAVFQEAGADEIPGFWVPEASEVAGLVGCVRNGLPHFDVLAGEKAGVWFHACSILQPF